MSRLKAFLREPLVHFGVLGGILFAVDLARTAPPPPDVESTRDRPAIPAPPEAKTSARPRTVVVDAATSAQIAENAERRLGRSASAAELAEETERWIDEEILYQEAVARESAVQEPVRNAG